MRLSPSRSFRPTGRSPLWRAAGPRLRRSAPKPTVIPTRPSVLQRLLWLFTDR